MRDSIESFAFVRDGISFMVHIVCFNEYLAFSDIWKMTDKHEGGVTIQNREHHRGSYKFGIPQLTTLAELTAQYAKQGGENPSSAAYQSLQDELMRDINASDYGFRVDANLNGVVLLNGESAGFSFDYSYHDEGQLIEIARKVFEESCEEEMFAEAKATAKHIVGNITPLMQLAA